MKMRYRWRADKSDENDKISQVAIPNQISTLSMHITYIIW